MMMTKSVSERIELLQPPPPPKEEDNPPPLGFCTITMRINAMATIKIRIRNAV